MKVRRLDYEFKANASKLHKLVGEILRTSEPWKGLRCYQEYPVSRINPEWKDGRAKFDWVLIDLRVVIEIHGEQHYKPVQFGGMNPIQARSEFIKRVNQDKAKRQAAQAAGYTYIELKYDQDITSDTLWKAYLDAKKVANEKDT